MNYSDFSLIQAQTAAGDPLFGGYFARELTEREKHRYFISTRGRFAASNLVFSARIS